MSKALHCGGRNHKQWWPDGTAQVAFEQPGNYQLSVSCNAGLVTSTLFAVSLAPNPPPTLAMTGTPSPVPAGVPFTVAWVSTDALNCVGTGGIPGKNWWFPESPLSGSVTQTAPTHGQYTYEMDCQSIDFSQPDTANQVTVTVGPAQPPDHTFHEFRKRRAVSGIHPNLVINGCEHLHGIGWRR